MYGDTGGRPVPMNNRIKEERKLKKVSQQELAEATGVSRQTIYAIEKGIYVPSTELALKMSAFFGKPVNDLFWL